MCFVLVLVSHTAYNYTPPPDLLWYVFVKKIPKILKKLRATIKRGRGCFCVPTGSSPVIRGGAYYYT